MNSFGRIFRISIFGESHGKAIGILIDECPAGIQFNEDDMLIDLGRRKSGKKGTTPRKESDLPKILSGVFEGKTTGSPVMILFDNKNIKPKDYSVFKDIPRPGHADFVSQKKYQGFQDYRGGGHFSGRLTLGLVAAGSLAKKVIFPIQPIAKITELGGSKDLEKAIDNIINTGNSIGGIIECKTTGIPIGLGEPFFDSVESTIAHLVFSIPAIKGIEFGLGFESSKKMGNEVNDMIIDNQGKTSSNNCGGINGGITNGNELIFKVVVKPTSSISLEQETYNFATQKLDKLRVKGRHDACIALRVPPIVEAVTAIALADMLLLAK